jgi:GNAT superfamily N-acetyltransferase
VKIRLAHARDFQTVSKLVYELLTELSQPKPLAFSLEETMETARQLLSGPAVWALLAESDKREAVGVLTLNECAAIYAGGAFGEVAELFVTPTLRSQGIGRQLIDAAVEFGKKRGWTQLEVCTPPVPQWERSVTFYQQNGFVLLGPRLKLRI